MKFLVSPEDAHVIEQHAWTVNNYGYVVRYVQVGGTSKAVLLHRHLLAAALLAAGPGVEVDHINGIRSDNRRENLRLCTHAENTRNRRMHRNNSTGFPNVQLDKRRGGYIAEIRVSGKKVRRAGFSTPEEAYQVARALVETHHGAFAKPALQLGA